MRIAIFGNTNNAPLVLAHALQERGHGVVLIVNETMALHRPENVWPEWKNAYPAWVHDVAHIEKRDYMERTSAIVPILRLLDSADTLIVNHIGPSLVPLLEGQPTISWLTGSDLDYFANFASAAAREERWSPKFKISPAGRGEREIWKSFVTRQREGIRNSDYVSFLPHGFIPASDALLDEIGVESERRFTIFFGDVSAGAYRPPPRHGRLRIFCGARTTWVKPKANGTGDLDYKGTDVLLRGFLLFLQTGTNSQAELRLVEKGLHVAETKALVEQLGLSGNVVWLKEMTRAAFQSELVEADICADQFDTSTVGLAGVDAMAVGRPLIAKAHLDEWQQLVGERPPICHADSPETVCEQLARLAGNEEERLAVGYASWAFVRKHWSPETAAEACLQRLTTAQQRNGQR